MKTSGRNILIPLTLLGLILFFLGRNILPMGGDFIGGRDVIDYFFLHAHFIKEQLLSLSLPLWNPYYYCGQPFLANPVNSVLYPTTLLLVSLPLHWAFNLDVILHLFLGALGTHLFVSLLTDSRHAGIASAVVYCFGGYFMERIFAGHVTMYHTPALIPWIFLFLEKGIKSERPRYFIVCGIVLGLQILAGYPQGSFYACIFLTIYFVMRYFSAPAPLGRKRFFGLGIYYFLIPLVSFGMSAAQIIPSLELMSLSTRASNSFDFATFMSFPPENFFTFLVPKPSTDPSVLDTNWEYGGYMGILAIILSGIGLWLSRHRHHARVFGVMALVSISIMLGRYTPLYKIYFEGLPFISTFRIPARCLVYLSFFTAILAGLGVKHLSDTPLNRTQHIVVMLFNLGIFILLFFGAHSFQIPLGSNQMLLALGLTGGCLVVLNLIRRIKNKRIAGALIIAALFIDLYLIYAPRIPTANHGDLSKPLKYEQVFLDDPGYYRVNVPHPTLSARTLRGLMFHYFVANGYTPIVLGDLYRFVHEMAGLPEPELRRHTFNKDLFSADTPSRPGLPGAVHSHPVFSSKILGIKYAVVRRGAEYRMIKAEKIMPRAVLVRNSVVLPRLEDHITHIKRFDFDPAEQVVLQETPAPAQKELPGAVTGSSKQDAVSIKRYRPNDIELEAYSGSAAHLVLSELFYPGWRAYVDGDQVPILRADYLLRAVTLPPGKHDVTFVFRPTSVYVGAAISALTVLILLGLLLIKRRPRQVGRS